MLSLEILRRDLFLLGEKLGRANVPSFHERDDELKRRHEIWWQYVGDQHVANEWWAKLVAALDAGKSYPLHQVRNVLRDLAWDNLLTREMYARLLEEGIVRVRTN